jgi:hypothetical protein
LIAAVSLVVFCFAGCNRKNNNPPEADRHFPKDKPLELNYETVSILLEDMQRYVRALKPLDREKLKRIDGWYKDVRFVMQQKPLFNNVYADPANGRVTFLLTPKDPDTGSTYLLKFNKKTPVVNSDTVEVQLRTQAPEEPLTCRLPMADPAEYVQGIRTHLFTVKYLLYKRFLQSGTFDFDGLTIPTYRTRGYPFIVFDVIKADLIDTTAKLNCECR